MELKKKLIITIGREYGSSGKVIAEKLGEILSIPVYDKNMLTIAAKQSGIKEDYLESEDERLTNPLFEPYIPFGMDNGSMGERLFDIQRRIMKEKAETSSCIFVGRCSDQILSEYENTFHFYVYAPRIARIKRIMEVEKIAECGAAEKILKKVDKQRKSYYQFFTDQKWGSTEGKDMMLNSGTLGIDGVVQVILDFLKVKGYVE